MAKKTAKVTKPDMMSDYEMDSMWMSYRYCIGRATIASHMRAGDIAKHCYNRMSDERSIFTAFDINREIEQHLSFGIPSFYFELTSVNKIFTSAIDVFCEYITEQGFTKKEQLWNINNVHVKWNWYAKPGEKNYALDVVTWDDYIKKTKEKILTAHGYKSDANPGDWTAEVKEKVKSIDKRISLEHYWLSNFNDLLVWNDLLHLFDKEHHHRAKLADGTEADYFWSWKEGYLTDDNGNRLEVCYQKVRIPIDKAAAGNFNWTIPDESVVEELY